MLERVVGPGKVSVVTTADVDEGKVSETQEIYDHEHPVIRSETRTVEGADAIAGIGGIAGTRGNLPGAPAAAPTAGSNSPERLQETKNYELSRTVRQTQKADSQLTRLHVAVVVDFKTGADGKPAARSDQELAELTALAKQAAGIDDARGDKIELHSIPFVPDPEQVAAAAVPPAKPALPMMWIAIGGGAALLVLVTVMMLVLRKKKRPAETAGALALPVPIAELERALEARAPAGLAAAPTENQPLLPGRTVRDRVLEAVRGDVDRAAEVLTAWLAEPPRKGAK
jgi:flagellar M-ring protein FliF